MDFSSQLLFFFSALGAFNGLLLGIYFLFFAKPSDLSNRFLGGLIIMLSIRVGKSVFFYFYPDLALDYLQMGLTACFFIGPFLYFYIKRLTQPTSNIEKEWKYHLLILVPFALWFGWTFPFSEYEDMWCTSVLPHLYHSWMLYILLAAYTARESIMKVFTNPKRIDKLDIWVISLLLGNALLAWIYYWLDFTYYISGALSFSFLLYLSWAFLFFNRENRIHYISEQKKYRDSHIEDDEASLLLENLEKLMNEEKIYTHSGLKLPILASKLKTSPHKLSQFLNENINKSFAQYVNELRVEEAKRLIVVNELLTLEAIGYEVGFNSRSTFYAAFKKYEGATPAQYKKTA